MIVKNDLSDRRGEQSFMMERVEMALFLMAFRQCTAEEALEHVDDLLTQADKK